MCGGRYIKIKSRGNKLKYYTFSAPKLPSRDNTDTDQAIEVSKCT